MKHIKILAVLAVIGLMAGMVASCEKESGENEISTEEKQEIPTEDQVTVTTDTETKIYGSESDGFGGSLIRRFKNVTTTFNENTTKVCIVTDGAMKAGLTRSDCVDIYECYRNGGVVIVTSPTYEGFTVSFQPDMAVATYLQNVVKYGIKIEDATPDPALYVSCFTDPEIPQGSPSPWSGIGFHNTGLLYCENLNGTMLEDSDEPGKNSTNDSDTELTPYQIGLRADEAVKWLEEKLTPSTKSTFDDLLNASMTKTYLHDLDYFDVYRDGRAADFQRRRKESDCFIENFIIKVAHDIGTHTDYYLVTQDADFRTSSIKPVPSVNNPQSWWVYEDSDHNKSYYYHHFLEWTTAFTVNCPGKSVMIRSSSPQADNSTTTETTTITNGTMESQSNGLSVGISGGFSGMSPTGSISASYSHTWTTGTTYTCGVGTTRSKKDISITKGGGANNKVSWQYNGTPGSWSYSNGDSGYYWWKVGQLQISDMTQTNSALIAIPGITSGTAELTIDNEWWYRTVYFRRGSRLSPGAKLPYRSAGNKSSNKLKLPMPMRFSQEWVLTCVEYGDAQNDFNKRSILSQNMFSQLMKGDATYKMGDSTAESTATAQSVLNMFMDRFKAWDTYGVKGNFKFQMKRIGDGKVITAQYEVK